MEINYLKHNQIDKQKWDSAIGHAENGLVYALSWYLDIVSPNWDALIVGNYETIMPITHKRKYGISYLYQPIFVQQLGIFSKNIISEQTLELFINKALKHFKLIDIKLNNYNPAPKQNIFILRQTQTLDLNKSYSDITAGYNRSLQSNLSKSKKVEFIFTYTANPNILIDMMREMYKRKNVEGIKESDFGNLYKIIAESIQKGLGKIYCANYDEQVYSAMFVITWKNRAFTFYGTSVLGREKRSMVALMDYFIRENASQNLVLDFCGSNIPGVAEWNLGFGAQNLTYYGVHLNNLPLWLKWIKKI